MPSALEFTDALSYAFDDLVVYTAAGGAANNVVINALVSNAANPSVSRLDSRYFYNREGNRQARVRTNGLTPATGTVSFDPASSPAPALNDVVQFTLLFPFRDGLDAKTSYLGFVNRALGLIDIRDRISVPIVPGQDAYDLTAVSATIARWAREDRFGWPDGPAGTVKILEPHPSSDRQPLPADWRGPSLRLDGGSVYLDLEAPFALGTSGTLSVNLLRPAFYWVGVNGAAFGESSIGLSNTTDLAAPPVEDVLAIARWLAIADLMARGISTSSGRWTQQDLATAEREARAVPGFNARSLQAAPPVAQAAGAA